MKDFAVLSGFLLAVALLFGLPLLLLLSLILPKAKARWVRTTVTSVRLIIFGIWCVGACWGIHISYALSHLAGDSKDVVQSEQKSPNNLFGVEVFNRLGGATSSNTTVVSVHSGDKGLNTREDFVLFRMEGIQEIKLLWKDENHLTIEYQQGVKVITTYERVDEWNGLHITYVEDFKFDKLQ